MTILKQIQTWWIIRQTELAAKRDRLLAGLGIKQRVIPLPECESQRRGISLKEWSHKIGDPLSEDGVANPFLHDWKFKDEEPSR